MKEGMRNIKTGFKVKIWDTVTSRLVQVSVWFIPDLFGDPYGGWRGGFAVRIADECWMALDWTGPEFTVIHYARREEE